MTPTAEYGIGDLAKLSGTTPRTVRYYVELGLLPPPAGAGLGARYGEPHLARLRLIRDLQRQHLPLAEIRLRLEGLDDASVVRMVEEEASPPPPDSALDYIRSILGEGGEGSLARPASMTRQASDFAPPPSLPATAPASAPPPPPPPAAPPVAPGPPPAPESAIRSQWERVSLAPDIELHIRRPLGRLQNRRVERLITIARELLEEDL